jgi:hypothetical protein
METWHKEEQKENEELLPKEFIDLLAKKLHTIWLENYKNSSSEPRYKTVSDPEIAKLDIDRFYGHNVKKEELIDGAPKEDRVNLITKLKMTDGTEKEVGHLKLYNVELGNKIPPEKGKYIMQDIAQEAELINPDLMYKLNGKLAKQYLTELEPMCKDMELDDFKEYENDMAAIVQGIWLKENKSWAPKELQVPFSQLPEEEKNKDRRIAKAVLHTVKEIEVIEQLKNIEIECMFEDISENSDKNIHIVADWIKSIDDSYDKLKHTPLIKYCDKTSENIQKVVPKDIYAAAHKIFLDNQPKLGAKKGRKEEFTEKIEIQ